jgi:Membrane-bound toxin component of toxin-antitoxin system
MPSLSNRSEAFTSCHLDLKPSANLLIYLVGSHLAAAGVIVFSQMPPSVALIGLFAVCLSLIWQLYCLKGPHALSALKLRELDCRLDDGVGPPHAFTLSGINALSELALVLQLTDYNHKKRRSLLIMADATRRAGYRSLCQYSHIALKSRQNLSLLL